MFKAFGTVFGIITGMTAGTIASIAMTVIAVKQLPKKPKTDKETNE